MISTNASGEKAFHLKVITPDRVIFDGSAESMQLPAHDGLLGILHNHAPMIALLGTGVLRIAPGGSDMFVSNGFVQVERNDVRVVCDSGEKAEEIDLERARAAEKRARERLGQQMKGEIDHERASAAFRRALLRQQIVERQKRRRTEHGLR